MVSAEINKLISSGNFSTKNDNIPKTLGNLATINGTNTTGNVNGKLFPFSPLIIPIIPSILPVIVPPIVDIVIKVVKKIEKKDE